MLMNGYFKYATRNSIKGEAHTDVFKLINFETAPEMIKKSLKTQKFQPIIDSVSASVFGELGTIGTGISKIILYKEPS
jgi:hypothetical protein